MSESEAVETAETTDVETDVDTAPETNEENHETETDGDTIVYAKSDLAKLRRSQDAYRQRAKTAEGRVADLVQQRHEALVRLDGRLQDSTDLPFDPDAVLEPDQITETITEMITAKPHLKSRKPTGDIGQGVRGTADEPFNLIGAIKAL
jgi:hypothetical protein